MAEHWKLEECTSIRVKLNALIVQEHTRCPIWGPDSGDESSQKDWGELDAQGTTQQSFNQLLLTAKLFSICVMFQDKDKPVHDQIHGHF